MTLFDLCKAALRIPSDVTIYDAEIEQLLEEAQADLTNTGVPTDTGADVDGAVVSYVKAHFGWNNPDADRLDKSYTSKLIKLSLIEREANT